jgi:hypothetical protein
MRLNLLPVLLFGCSSVVGLGDIATQKHPTDAAGQTDALASDGAVPDPDMLDSDALVPVDPDDGIVDPDGPMRPPFDATVGPIPDGCVPVDEVCNGVDDDCDGRSDEALVAPFCENQRGVCVGATRVCGGARGWDICDDGRFNRNDPAWTPVENAIHCDGRDNDCDGEADEGCECRPDETQACGVDVGNCRAGVQRCDNGVYGACSGRGPEVESCDGDDEDCDGTTDEGAECGRDEACQRGECVRTRWVYEVESGAFGHSVGRRDGNGWSANTDLDAPGYLAFGPYTRDLPAGQFDARFRMQIDIVNADNNEIVRIDVNDFDRTPDCGDCVLVSRTLRRRDFEADRRDQDFTLRFQNPVGHRLEFRTFWLDRSYVKQDRVEVVPAP